MNFKIGTRGSKLSISQTNWVIRQIKQKNPEHNFMIQTITTKGDTDARPLFAIDQKGIFEKEIDRAVSEKKVDFAIHSLKDVPSQLPVGLTLACVPKREQVNDVFISKNDDTLESILPESIVGTSSLRRAVQVSTMRPDLVVRPIRGNIETRIDKVQNGDFDAIVLAKAGILRLGSDVKYHVLDTRHFSPSPGQGAIAVVCRQDDETTMAILKSIEDPDSRLEIEAERAVSDMVDSGCRFPVGAYAKIDDEKLIIQVSAFSVDGKISIFAEKSGSKEDAIEIGRQAGKELQNNGVSQLALNWRQKVEEWNKR